jgi:hypothetical protein
MVLISLMKPVVRHLGQHLVGGKLLTVLLVVLADAEEL